ncbi:MAG: S8 family serine peptidase [Opitutae bacterium]|nr:S8 family serine peptidase [Opitutae bacterium]
MTHPRFVRLALVSLLALLPWSLAQAEAAPSAKKPVQSVDDLPRHTYPLTQPPSVILKDAAAFARLAVAVKQNIEADLAAYDIQDRTTLQRYKGALLALALLDGSHDTARRLIAELRALEEKPGLKLTAGLLSEAWLNARRQPGAPQDFAAAFQAEVSALVGRMPWDLVQDEIKRMKAGFEVRSEALLIGVAREQLDPAAQQTGAISGDVAAQLLAMRNQLVNFLPLKTGIVAALDAVVAAHRVTKPDRWTPRLATLAADEKARPVAVGVWDSGVDTALFTDRLLADAQGRCGFAFDLHADPVPELIFPLGDAAARMPGVMARLKGFLDLQAAVDSPDATALKRYMSELKAEQVKATIEDLSLAGNWSHGTHVTGIALAGNPFARLVVGRITFDHRMIPEKPTVEQARKDAAAYQAAVDYFKRAGVRVVNMSWGGALKDVEEALEANGAGGTAEERKKLAREIFDIGRAGLLAAFKSAPGILFVTAAGNSDNNVKFDEVIPSSFQLPNMITVGAVDQAGEETSFSSFGPMVNVHANGFEVESFVPGGTRLKFSGTSMASPQVANLAAKLIALDPALTPEAARELILAGCEQRGRVNLVHPAKSVALLRAKLADMK